MATDAGPTSQAPSRYPYLDYLRVFLVLMVIVQHAAVTYSGLGGWYYKEGGTLLFPEFLGFAWLQSHLQSFFMGLLFLMAGYFVPPAFDRKGLGKFLRDRWFRLGWPSLFYMLLIHPTVTYGLHPIYHPDQSRPSFTDHYLNYLWSGRVFSGSGPLWFAIVLLLFCIVYAGIRAIGKSPVYGVRATPPPGNWAVVGYIAIAGIVTGFVRVVQPLGTDILNIQLCFSTQYILLFCIGILAYRNDWLGQIPTRFGFRWLSIGLTVGMALWLAVILASKDDLDLLKGGWTWPSFGFAIWDAFFCAGASLGLLVLFRDRFNRSFCCGDLLIRNAFSIYVFHTPILIAVTVALRPFSALPSVKFLVAIAMAIPLTILMSEWVFRRIPILRAIL